jgi:hypothetical protein
MDTAALLQPNCSATSAINSAFAFPSTGGDFSFATHVPSDACVSDETLDRGVTLTWMIRAGMCGDHDIFGGRVCKHWPAAPRDGGSHVCHDRIAAHNGSLRMKNIVLAIGLTLWCATVAAAGPSHIDRGWMTNNRGGQCQMLRGVWVADGSNVMLTVAIYRDPIGGTAPKGQMQLMLALVEDGGIVNEKVESFAILDSRDDAAGKYTITPEPQRGLSFLLGADANAALRSFETERFVRVKLKDGSVAAFSLPPKNYETSRTMFDACSKSRSSAASNSSYRDPHLPAPSCACARPRSV